ncbi:hypothetical protein SeLEV6574_g05196 [Synchytrium endobioticum]|nr:hypothetical protein SeLEV6574_g05196 [Synchytrium endobioticum]
MLESQYRSEPLLHPGPLSSPLHHGHLFPAQSEPILHNRCASPDDAAVAYHHLIAAADALEAIVAEGALVGISPTCLRSLRAGAGQLSRTDAKARDDEKVLGIVYGTMKYLHYIDIVLVKTQFLVYYPAFLSCLGLVKVVIYLHLQHHFDATRWLRFVPSAIPSRQAETIASLDESVKLHSVKLGAALARLRIEKRAVGETVRDQVEALLPFEIRIRESVSVGMHKCVRVNLLRTTPSEVSDMLRNAGFHVDLSQPPSLHETQAILSDPDFDDLLVVPASIFNDLKSHDIMTSGLLIFQDKASAYAPRQLVSLLPTHTGLSIMDARAGCGTRVAHIAALTRDKHHILAFESRTVRTATLRSRLDAQGIKNVEVMHDDFMSANTKDPRYEHVTAVICEPACSGSAIVDKLGYMLQEEEFPADRYSTKDLVALKRQQYLTLRKASQFPNVRHIVYVTRATRRDENQGVVDEFLDMGGGQWTAVPVLPHMQPGEMFLEHLPSQSGNGIFIACFSKCVLPLSHDIHPDSVDADNTVPPAADVHSSFDSLDVPIKKRRSRATKQTERTSIARTARLSRTQLRASVERLSTTKEVSLPSLANSKRPSHVTKKLVSNDETVQDRDAEGRGQETTNRFEDDFDFIILGSSLKHFFAPRNDALGVIATRRAAMRWSYPVPNPVPWK